MNRVLTVLIIALILANLTLIHTPRAQRNKLAIIYAPGFDYQLFKKYIGTSSSIVTNSTIVTFQQYPPYTPLYYELQLFYPRGYNIAEGIPENTSIRLWNGSIIPVFSYVNQSIIKSFWGDLDTVFVNIEFIDPTNISRAVNLAYDIARKYIPPSGLELKVNEKIHWDLLDTDVELSITNTSYIVKLIDLNTTINIPVNTSVSPVITINIPGNHTNLDEGSYRLKFAIYDLGDGKYVLVTPGTIKSDTVFSEFYKGYNSPITPHYPLDKNLLNTIPTEAIKWIIDEVSSFYIDLVNYMLSKYNKLFTLVYYPLTEEASKLVLMLNDTEVRDYVLNETYIGIHEVVKKIMIRMGNDRTQVMIVSPYTINQELAKLDYVAPGIIEYNATIVDQLLNNGVELVVRSIGDRKLVYILNGAGYSKGCILLYPGNAEIVDTGDISPLALFNNYLGTTGFGLRELLAKIDDLRLEVEKLNNKVNELNTTVNSYKLKVEDLNKQLGEANSTVIELQNRIAELNKEIEDINAEKQQVYLYLTVGLVGAIVLSIIYMIIIRAIAKRK